MKMITDNPGKSLGVGTLIVVLTLVAGIFKFDDRYAKAGSVEEIQTSIKNMETVQQTAITNLDKHLTFEKQEAIYDYEDRIEKLERKPVLTDDERADLKKFERRLRDLRANN